MSNKLDVKKIADMNNIFEKFIENYKSDIPLIMYGAGRACLWFLKILKQKNIEPKAICDSDEKCIGKKVGKFTVSNFKEEIRKYDDYRIIISAPSYQREIKRYLLEHVDASKIISFTGENHIKYMELNEYRKYLLDNEQRINKIYSNLSDEKSKDTMSNILKGLVSYDIEYFVDSYETNQYFPSDIISLNESETFVDVGAYNGDTMIDFIERTKGKFNRIYEFEPDTKQFERLVDISNNITEGNEKKVVLKNVGIYKDDKILGFNTGDTQYASSHIDNCEEKVEFVSLDNVIDENVTFIKMDIEGAELDALKGASNIIRKYRPKLAICIYHKNEDIIDIPEYVMSLGLDYKYYIRHHKNVNRETVFYAV